MAMQSHSAAQWVMFAVATLLPGAAIGTSLNVGVSVPGMSFRNTCACLAPSDMAMAVGPNAVVQMVNGGYEVFSKSGFSLTAPQSDIDFWLAAGLPPEVALGDISSIPYRIVGPSDPRLVFDPASGRFFALQIAVSSYYDAGFSFIGQSTEMMLGVSNTSDPLDGWRAVSFLQPSGYPNGFTDFPGLGVDANAVYIGTDNFADPTSSLAGTNITITSIPKADLLGAAPSLARLSSFTALANSDYGRVPQPAIDTGGQHGAVLSFGPNPGQATLSKVTGSGTASPAISTPIVLDGLPESSYVPPLQPGGSVITDFDNRFSAPPFVAGDLLYAARSVGDPAATTDFVQWMIVDLTSDLVLQQGAISEPGAFYTYPSIAANANGDFVIGFNRSSADVDLANFISGYAVGCHYDGSTAGCGAPTLLASGRNLTFDGRWGDYSATAVDPTDPNIFWTAQGIVAADGNWATQLTQLQIAPEPETLPLLGIGAGLLIWRRKRRVREHSVATRWK
jgi:hypothetical protein